VLFFLDLAAFFTVIAAWFAIVVTGRYQVDDHQPGQHVGQGHQHQGRDPGGRAGT
jgi:hypothetical protein